MNLTKRKWAAVLIGLLTLLVSACGDSNNEIIIGQNGNNNQNPVLAGSYLGANTFIGQTAVLSLNVANDGSAAGTLTVTDLLQAQSLNINPGAYNVTGSVNLNTGSFALSGSFPGVGPFSIAGTLPTGNNQGTYTLIVNGQTFNGRIQNSNLGTPTPPPINGGNGESRLFASGVLSDFTFTPDNNYNGVNPPVDNGSTIGGALITGFDTENLVSITISEIEGNAVRSLVFGVVTQTGDIEVGETYPLILSEDGDGSLLSLSESVGTTIEAAWITEPGTSTGSVTVVAIDEEGVELDFNFDNVIPNSEVANNTAQGSFDVSGTVVADFAPVLP